MKKGDEVVVVGVWCEADVNYCEARGEYTSEPTIYTETGWTIGALGKVTGFLKDERGARGTALWICDGQVRTCGSGVVLMKGATKAIEENIARATEYLLNRAERHLKTTRDHYDDRLPEKVRDRYNRRIVHLERVIAEGKDSIKFVTMEGRI